MLDFKNSNQLKSFMKKESQRLNISISNVYTTFVSRSFLERISENNNNEIIVKGSSAEISYLGSLVRCITDVDIATMDKLEINKKLLEKIISDNKVDKLEFKLLKDPKQTKTGIYKFSLEADFDKMKQPLNVDLQEKYNRLIEPEIRVMPPIFEGDKPFEILVPSFEEYLAEKMCIILESNKPDVLNTRVKDFYDIYQLHGGKYDSDKLTHYFKKMLELRGKITIEEADTIYLDQNFINNHSKLWENIQRRYDFLDKEIDLAGAVYYTRAVLREQLQKNGREMTNTINLQKR